jgi:tetratricopeptide (TPR) repeat protein
MAATTTGDSSKAIAYARQAAERALAGLAFEEAAKYYEQSLAALHQHHDRGGDLLRCDLTIALSDAQRRTGEADYRRAMTEAVTIARSLGDSRRLAMAVLVSARPGGTVANSTVVDQELIALFEEALAGLRDEDDDVLRAKILAQLSAELLYTGEFDRRHRLSGEAVAIARRSGDQSVLAFALYAHAVAINVPTALAERLALTAEMEALGERSGSIETRWNAAYHRFGALLESGDIVRAEQMLARLRELIPKLRQPYFNWVTSLACAMLCVMRGAPDAEQQVSAAFELGRAGGQPDANMVHLAQLFVIRRDQGRYGELVDPLRQFVQAQPHLPVWGATLAGLYCETDQLDQARAQVAMLAANGFHLPVDWTWPSAVMSLAQVASDLGDRTLAEHFYPQLQKVAGQVGVTGIGLVCYGSARPSMRPAGRQPAALGRGRPLFRRGRGDERTHRRAALPGAHPPRLGRHAHRPQRPRGWRADRRLDGRSERHGRRVRDAARDRAARPAERADEHLPARDRDLIRAFLDKARSLRALNLPPRLDHAVALSWWGSGFACCSA